VYDRAALIALPPDMRRRYAQQINSLLAIDGRALLISLEYDPEQMSGPPFTVSESEVRALFGERKIEKLHEHDCTEDEPQFKQRGVTWMNEVVYRLE
jgi:thiopurine S-methyltransferase